MTTITQRLREIAKGLAEGAAARRGLGLDKAAELYSIAAELEAPAADAVPVVAVMTSYARSNELNFWTREAASLPTGEYRLVTEAAHLATVAALQARINELESRQVPASADDEYAVVWPDGARFVANTLKSAEDYMSGAVPSCAKRGVELPVIVRYVPAETVPYAPHPDTSKEQP